MQIHHLRLQSKHLKEQFHFYSKVLGFSCKYVTKDSFELITQENKITFYYSPTFVYYHFAFLIPTGTLQSAIEFLASRNIDLLPYQNKRIIQFTSGQSIYFYDKDQNIAEFIERPKLDYPEATVFSIDQVVKVNEIGLPVEEPIAMANNLVENFGIRPNNNPPFRENFCWVGDHHGVIIVTKVGRNWLPTDLPGIVNDFSVHYSDQGKDYRLAFEENNIIRK